MVILSIHGHLSWPHCTSRSPFSAYPTPFSIAHLRSQSSRSLISTTLASPDAPSSSKQDIQQPFRHFQTDSPLGSNNPADVHCATPSCPFPDFSTSSQFITLLNPCKPSPNASNFVERGGRPLFIYVPGMDCTGQGVRNQLPHLIDAGYDVRCVYIPTDDRSSWDQLVEILVPLINKEQVLGGRARHVTMLGESFGGPLALRLALAAPNLISRLVLVNPGTNFEKSSPFASFWSSTGLLAMFPKPLYKIAQDILLSLMVNHDRVQKTDKQDRFSPLDLVPAGCAAWRFSLLNDGTGLGDLDISTMNIPTLVLSSAEDHVLSSVEEGGRLQRLLPNAKRIILPNSGHTALLEDSLNLTTIMEAYGFSPLIAEEESGPQRMHLQASNFLHNGQDSIYDEKLDELGRILDPWRFLTSPLISGEENLPNPESKRPMLFVGNHTLFGFYDTPILFHELFLRGFHCRALAHPGHWRIGTGQLFERYGHVKASKFAAYRLLKEGEHVLLFPGGAREVHKRKGQEYKLLWRPTADFVRMASRFKAIIIPFGIVGGDDAYKILIDADELLESPIGPFVQALVKRFNVDVDSIYPITAFPGTNEPSPIAIPSIERIYIHFAEPVDTTTYGDTPEKQDKYNTMYLLVKDRVERSIDLLKQVRSNDEERDLSKRLLGKFLRRLKGFNRV